MFEDRVNKLKEIIKQGHIVVFTGAGISTLSGMKDFRSPDGLYNEKNEFDAMPEEILSHNYFYQHPTEFYKFYRKKMNCLPFEPNVAHKLISKLEDSGLLDAVITQNIDNLHQKSGSRNVIELHGTCMRNYCVKCGKEHDVNDVFYGNNKYPVCDYCNHLVRPDIVLYDERLNMNKFMSAQKALNMAKTCIVIGSSMTVFPAANLLSEFYGPNLVIINRDEVKNEKWADIVFHEDMKLVFDELTKEYD